MAKEASPDIATIIIISGLTILASTAACPRIRPPTIPMVGPIGLGTLTPASFISSKAISSMRSSTIPGNGTSCLEDMMGKSIFVSIRSWW